MTKIIPIRPFGKDLKEQYARDSSLNKTFDGMTKSGSGELPESMKISFPTLEERLPSIGLPPSYKYDKLNPRIEVAEKYVYLCNMPYNFVRDGKWVQGVWKKIGLRTPEDERKNFVEWTVARSNVTVVVPPIPFPTAKEIIPPLPLLCAAISFVNYLDQPSNRVLPVDVAHRVLQSHFFHSGTFTSSGVMKGVDSVMVTHGHGVGSMADPFVYNIRVPIAASGSDLIVPLSGMRGHAFESVMKWVNGGGCGVALEPIDSLLLCMVSNPGKFSYAGLSKLDEKLQAGVFLISYPDFEVVP